MDTLWRIIAFAHPVGPAVIVVLGLAQLWQGLRGAPDGEGGLVRRRTSAYGRMLGFRTTLFGLVVVGLGLGWLLQDRLLIFLSLGFGIVELRESSLIISAVRFRHRPLPVAQRLG